MLSFTASISEEVFDYCLHVYIAHLAAVQSTLLSEYQHRWIYAVSIFKKIVITPLMAVH